MHFLLDRLEITILLSIVMFSLLISDIIPASSTALPQIVLYFATVMMMTSISVVATVIVLVLHHRNAKNHVMPNWVREDDRSRHFLPSNGTFSVQIEVYINQYLAWLLRMNRPGHDLSWRAIRQNRSRDLERQNSMSNDFKSMPTPLLAQSSKSLLANVISTDDPTYVNTGPTLPMSVMNHIAMRHPPRCKNPHHNHDPSEVLYPRDMRAFRSDLKNILHELKYLTGHVRKEEEEDDISQDWKFSAMVIDRLCLILFTIMTTIFSYVTLFSAPNFFKFR